MMDSAVVSETGGRTVNMDCAVSTQEYDCACFVIADGCGSMGRQAANAAVQSVVNGFKDSQIITTGSMPEFFAQARASVAQIAREFSDDTMATTLTALLTDGNCAVWGNIGDSRLYHFKDGFIYEITPDHSPAYKMYTAGEIRYPEIRDIRVEDALSAMIGVDMPYMPEFAAPTIVKESDAFLMCTDGFWQNITELQIERALKKSKNAKDWLDRMVKVVKQTIRGSRNRYYDDFSAIVIKL